MATRTRGAFNPAKDASETLRGLENPFPFFAEATDAASQLFQLQKEYFKLAAEVRARREAKRAGFLAAALLLAGAALTLGLYWVTYALHEAGWSSMTVAIVSFLVFGAAAGICAWVGIQAGRGTDRKPKEATA